MVSNHRDFNPTFPRSRTSLVETCTKVAIRNVQILHTVGVLPYHLARPILQCVTSSTQLHTIEINSPQIKGDDAELWRKFIERDIPNWREKNYVPKNPEKWYEVYCRYKREKDAEIERDQEVLRQTMMGLKAKKQSNVSQIIDLRKLPKLPKDPRMMPNIGGVPIVGKSRGPQFRKEGASSLNWTSGSKTKITDGQSVLAKARREAKDIQQMGKLSRPTAYLSGSASQIKKAPAAMATEYKIKAQPEMRLSTKRKPPSSSGGISGPSWEDRERKLLAAKSGPDGAKRNDSGLARATMVGSSDEDSDGDDLFDDPPRKSSSLSRPTPSSSKPSDLNSKLSRPRPITSSSRPSSDLNTKLSRPRPAPSASPSSKPHNSTFHNDSNSPAPRHASPAPGGAVAPKPMMPRKRPAAVDCFNRKKPRVTR